MVKLGYARVYLIQPNVKYADELVEAEIESKKENRVIWIYRDLASLNN